MKKCYPVVVGLGIGLLGIGCARDGAPPNKKDTAKESEPYVKINKEKIKQDMEAFQKKAEAALEDFDDQVADLKEKAAKAGAEVKAKLDVEIKELNQKREAANKRLEEIKSATVENWPEVRSHLDAALGELKKGFAKALSSFE